MLIGPTFGFFAGLLFLPIALRLCRAFGLYAIVNECEAQVFTLFGKVLGVLDEPGLQIPVARFGPKAFLVPFFGKRHRVSTALRQHYLRSQMVNSEEGTPMGVGIWYEMAVSDPVSLPLRQYQPGRLAAGQCRQLHHFDAVQPGDGGDAGESS